MSNVEVYQHYSGRFPVLRATNVMEMTEIIRKQEIPEECYHPNPVIVLFISHRWNDPNHPDLSSQQLIAVKQLLDNIVKVLHCMEAGNIATRMAVLPKVEVHGVLQALLVLYRTMVNSDNMDPDDLNEHTVLQHIGVWYDYMCIPQKPRTTSEDHVFKESLSLLSSILRCRNVMTIALRTNDDDYLERGWCVSECACSTVWQDDVHWSEIFPIGLQIDALGDSLPIDSGFKELTDLFAEWSNPASKVPTHQLFFKISELCAQHQTINPQSVYTSNDLHVTIPSSSVSMKLYYILFIRIMEGCGTKVELVPLIHKVSEECGLSCTNKNEDTVVAALLILTSKKWSVAATVKRLNDDGEVGVKPSNYGQDIWDEALHHMLFGSGTLYLNIHPDANRFCDPITRSLQNAELLNRDSVWLSVEIN